MNAIRVEGLGEIVRKTGDFHSLLSKLKNDRAGLITPRDEAYARIKTAGGEDIGKLYGTWATAGFEYAKGELPLLRLDSRLLAPELAIKAVKANKIGEYFSTDSISEYKQSLKIAKEDESKAPQERRVIVLPSKKNFIIKPAENYEVLQFLLKDQADKYFELNGSAPISAYLISQDNLAENRTTLTQLWFRGLGSGSVLDGLSRSLDFGDRTRGVRDAEGIAKISTGN